MSNYLWLHWLHDSHGCGTFDLARAVVVKTQQYLGKRDHKHILYMYCIPWMRCSSTQCYLFLAPICWWLDIQSTGMYWLTAPWLPRGCHRPLRLPPRKPTGTEPTPHQLLYFVRRWGMLLRTFPEDSFWGNPCLRSWIHFNVLSEFQILRYS